MKALNFREQDLILKLLISTLAEVFNGPLNGKSIALVLDTSADQYLNVSQLLSSIPGSYILLEEQSAQQENSFTIPSYQRLNFSERSSKVFLSTVDDVDTLSLNEAQGNNTEDLSYLYMDNEDAWQDMSLTGIVMVYIKTGEKLEILDSPPLSWSLAALLIISTTEECEENTIQTELANRTSFLAVMCPYIHSLERNVNKLAFTLHTWQPFHPQRKWTHIGKWSSNNTWKDLFIDRFPSFHGTVLHLASDDGEPPYLYTAEDGSLEGINGKMLHAIAGWLDFKYVPIQEGDELNWGENINGTWNGMLGDVFSGNKDLTINSYFITFDKAKDFDFSIPYGFEGYGFAVKQPSPLPRWHSIAYPFSIVSWGALVLTVFVTPLAFYLIQLNAERRSYTICVFLILQSLVNQGTDYKPKSLSLRIFLTTWWFSAYVIGIIYACNLISFFTVPVYPQKITTLEQLAESPYKLCMLDYGDSLPETLRTASRPLLSALGKKLELVPVVMELEHLGTEGCVERLMKSSYVHLDFLPYLESFYSLLGLSQKVYFIKSALYENFLTIYFRKNTPWKYKFDRGIRHLSEAGLIQKWNNDIRKQFKKYSRVVDRESDNQPLSIVHLQGPFLILAFLSFLFSLSFCLEIIFK